MTLRVPLPAGEVTITAAIFDVNGTLTDRGQLVTGVTPLMAQLREMTRVLLVSSDTYGTLDDVVDELRVEARRVSDATEKLALLHALGAQTCVAVGNGHNDRLMLEAAALGIAVLGAEGTAASAILSADVVCTTVVQAIGLLLEPTALVATLRP